jgi:hypothetical protein
MLNLMGMAVVLWLGWRARMEAHAALAWCVAWPLTQVLLVLQPQLRHYAGLSGTVHAGVAVMAVVLWCRRGRDRRFGVWLAGGLMLKLLSERAWTSATHTVEGWNFELAPMAHVTGTVAGVLCAGLVACCVSASPGDAGRSGTFDG